MTMRALGCQLQTASAAVPWPHIVVSPAVTLSITKKTDCDAVSKFVFLPLDAARTPYLRPPFMANEVVNAVTNDAADILAVTSEAAIVIALKASARNAAMRAQLTLAETNAQLVPNWYSSVLEPAAKFTISTIGKHELGLVNPPAEYIPIYPAGESPAVP